MSVQVVSGTVDTGEKVFFPGDIITGLKDKDEQELVSCGACRYTDEAPIDDEVKPEIDENGLVKLGGGIYQLPNGEKVRGKEKALEALAELNQSNNDGKGEGSTPNDPGAEGSGPNTGIPGVDG
jgi:hypothetical protein